MDWILRYIKTTFSFIKNSTTISSVAENAENKRIPGNEEKAVEEEAYLADTCILVCHELVSILFEQVIQLSEKQDQINYY